MMITKICFGYLCRKLGGGPKPVGSEADVDSLRADIRSVWSQTAVVVSHFVVRN